MAASGGGSRRLGGSEGELAEEKDAIGRYRGDPDRECGVQRSALGCLFDAVSKRKREFAVR